MLLLQIVPHALEGIMQTLSLVLHVPRDVFNATILTIVLIVKKDYILQQTGLVLVAPYPAQLVLYLLVNRALLVIT
jgi:hypothetical protein